MANTGNWSQEELEAGFFELPEGSNTATNQKRVNQVKSARSSAMNTVNNTYDGMINQSDKFYQDQINASKEYAETQAKNQQEQTDFAIEQIEQQKAQAEKDYKKEQSGAYVDWQKQSGEYGANAEAMAVQGMGGTGYSESAQVSMYNTYQNRVATARETYSRAVLNYDNAIKDARLQNNAALAEIAYNALQTQLELALEGFQYKNSLIQEKTKLGMEVDNEYYSRYTDVLDQINTENALAEEIRQYNESLAEEKRQYNQNYSLQQAELQLAKDKFAYEKKQDAAAAAVVKSSGGSVSSKSSSSKTTSKASSTGVKKTTSKSKGELNRGQGTGEATAYLNALIASGASKDKVSNEIAIALREGAITKVEAQNLRNKFTPRGVQY